MYRNPFLPLILIAALVLGGWYFREPVLAWLHPAPPPPSARADVVSHSDTVYRWVDKNGVAHFDQNGGADRKAVSIDQHRIQSFEALAPVHREAARTAAAGSGPTHPHQYYEP
jgi:hypothetical protein